MAVRLPHPPPRTGGSAPAFSHSHVTMPGAMLARSFRRQGTHDVPSRPLWSHSHFFGLPGGTEAENAWSETVSRRAYRAPESMNPGLLEPGEKGGEHVPNLASRIPVHHSPCGRRRV